MMNLPSRPSPPAPDRWPPLTARSKTEWEMPGWGTTIWRGVLGKCPHCGKAKIFNGYLKVHAVCAYCAAPLGQMPADDAPPYIAMLAVLHVMAFIVLMIFRFHLSPGIPGYAALLVLLIAACMVALRMAKGAVIGILLKLGLKREALDG